MYASPPAGTAAKKSPATQSQRDKSPAASRAARAPSRTFGSCEMTPRVAGLACRISTISASCPPADIDDGRKRGEVIGRHERHAVLGHEPCHGLIEDFAYLRMVFEVRKRV